MTKPWAVCALLCLGMTTVANGIRIIQSPAGKFRGKELTSPGGHQFAAYRKIPYAKPPVGPLRFARPQPIGPLQGTYDATKEIPACIQPPGTELGIAGFGQEDCLYLNVYTPVNPGTYDATKEIPACFQPPRTELGIAGFGQEDCLYLNVYTPVNPTGTLKVLVFSHGGGGFMDSSIGYVPGDFVATSNVIVVTINYRLGWLAFLRGDSPELTGDQGKQDQILALKWVRDNIASFGGDGTDVTLGGQSTGGFDVSMLAIMEEAKDLFTKGLVMSESSFTATNTFGDINKMVPTLAKKVGCYNSTNMTLTPEEVITVLDCMRALPESAFSLQTGLTDMFIFYSVYDYLLPQPVVELVRNRTYLQEVGFFNKTFLVTLTNNEGPVCFYGAFGVPKLPGQTNYYDQYAQILGVPSPVMERAFLWHSAPDVAMFSPIFDILSLKFLYDTVLPFLEIHSDGTEALKDTNDAEGELYFLKWDHFPAYVPPPHQGMFHGIDLVYLFDAVPGDILRTYYDMDTTTPFSSVDHWLRDYFFGIVKDFMTYGNPGKSLNGTAAGWAPYNVSDEDYLSLSASPTVRQHPLREQVDFWKETVPLWIEEYKASGGTTPKPEDTNGGDHVIPRNSIGVLAALLMVVVASVLSRFQF